MAEKKITESEILMAIKAMALGEEVAEGIYVEDIVSYVDTKMEQKAKKAARGKELAEKKKAEGDMLTNNILAILTDEPQTIEDIVAALDDPEATPAKVRYRLSNLAKEEKITRVEKDKKKVYSL